MKYWTWAEIRAKIEGECDTEDEDFVRSPELIAYCNEAIDEAEAEIHTLYEDYFLSYKDITITSGDEFIDIATQIPDIYADKIRRILFKVGDTSYTVKRLKDWKKFENKADLDLSSSTADYSYFIVNKTVGVPQIMLSPKAHESGTIKVWYLRNANRITMDTDICDIPEFINFIFAYLKVKIFGKEGHPGYPETLERLENERVRMNAVLSNRVPDDDNEVELDLRIYTDMN